MEKQQSIHTLSPLSWVRRSFTVQPAVENDLSDEVLAAGIPSRPRATCPSFVHCCDLLKFQNGRSSACVVSVLANTALTACRRLVTACCLASGGNISALFFQSWIQQRGGVVDCVDGEVTLQLVMLQLSQYTVLSAAAGVRAFARWSFVGATMCNAGSPAQLGGLVFYTRKK